MALTLKQTLFIAEYLKDFNATRAARASGYSPKTARYIGFENLTKPHIQAALEAAIEARMERLQMSQDDVLHELAILGMSNEDNYLIDDEGNLSLKPGVHTDALRAIAGFDRTVTYTEDGSPRVHVKLRLWNKPAALPLMARHLGMLHDKIEHSGKIEGDLSGKSVEELRRMVDEFRRREEEGHANGKPDAPA